MAEYCDFVSYRGDCNTHGAAYTQYYVPLLPCPPEICPAEVNSETCERCRPCEIKCNASWWRNRKPDTTKRSHDDCWCNGWNSKIKKPTPPAPPKRQPILSRMNWRQRAAYERELREKLYPPPPSNICNYKPCTMELKPPTWNNPTWTAYPQKCIPEPVSSYYTPGPCQRQSCVHVENLRDPCYRRCASR